MVFCIEECPFFLLRADADGIPEMIPGAEAVCLKCGHCLAICPNGAIALELTANSMGIGGCWAGYFMRASNNFEPLKQFIYLPNGHRVYAALMLGYPRFKYHRIPPRQALKICWL
jgi:nitroreductase